jgi:parallel beta-helix repeat protein
MNSNKLSSTKAFKRWFFILSGICLMGVSTVLAQPSVKSTSYYVAPNGSDSNSGTRLDLPLATITKAAELVKPGDRVLVRGGNYKVEQTIKINSKGTAEKPIVVCPYKNEQPVLDFTALKKKGRTAQAVLFGPGTQCVIFEGFELVNGSTGIRLELCNNVTVRNCILHDFDFVGLSVGSDECLIENNELYRICMAWENCNDKSGGWPQVMNTSRKTAIPPATVCSHARNNVFRGNYVHDSWGEGIDPMFSDGVIVENNIIGDVFAAGIYMDGTRNAIIRNNYIYTTSDDRMRTNPKERLNGIFMGSEYFGGWMDYPPISHVENIYIYNNVISRVGTGVGHWKDLNNLDRKNIYENVKIFNNTIDTYNGEGHAIRFVTDLDYPTKGNECKNNIFRSSRKISAEPGFIFENNLWVNGIPKTGNHVNSFTGDPVWIDPQPGKAVEGYRINAKSIAIGKAQPIDGLTTDKNGTKRNAASSLGAMETGIKMNAKTGAVSSSIANIGKQPTPDFVIGVNIVRNSHFDLIQGTIPEEWQIEGDKDAVSPLSPGYVIRDRPRPSADHPENCIKLGKSGDFRVKLTQTLTNIPNGRYGLHVRVKRFGEGGDMYFETSNFGGKSIQCNLPLATTLNEWADYSKKFFQPNISDIEVTNGTCTISFFVSGSASDYALIDDVCFFRY